MIVIGDVHGCFKTLMELIKKLPDKKFVFTGDLIDRGKQSKDVIDFVIKNDHYCVMGNHEDMMIIDYNAWMYNGGLETLKLYKTEDEYGFIKEFEEHKEWIKNLPLIIEYKNFIISHSAAFDVWNKDHESHYFINSVLWGRDFKYHNNQLPEGIINIFGHTPIKKFTKFDNYYMIDTGCFFKNHSYGILTAYDMDDDIIYEQENVE